jgi:hypothetical protein
VTCAIIRTGKSRAVKGPLCHAKVGASRLCESGTSKLSEGGDFVFTKTPTVESH